MAVVPRSIDPSGVAPVTDPSVVGGAPDASPTTLVLQYLRQRGFTPTTENVRRALEANQRDPGVIPGLRSDRPATEAEDQAAMVARADVAAQVVDQPIWCRKKVRSIRQAVEAKDQLHHLIDAITSNNQCCSTEPVNNSTDVVAPTVASQPPANRPPVPVTQQSPVTSFDTETPPAVNTGVPRGR